MGVKFCGKRKRKEEQLATLANTSWAVVKVACKWKMSTKFHPVENRNSQKCLTCFFFSRFFGPKNQCKVSALLGNNNRNGSDTREILHKWKNEKNDQWKSTRERERQREKKTWGKGNSLTSSIVVSFSSILTWNAPLLASNIEHPASSSVDSAGRERERDEWRETLSSTSCDWCRSNNGSVLAEFFKSTHRKVVALCLTKVKTYLSLHSQVSHQLFSVGITLQFQ